MTRYIFYSILMLVTFLVAEAEGEESPPHIVFIMADDLGWNDVGFHGSTIKTPNLDKLAKGGLQLNQFYVMPVCSPTRACLMSGRYPIRTGLQVGVVRPWADHGLPLDERTLSQALKKSGYYTTITGKWHLGSTKKAHHPEQRGFDHQYGHYLGAIDYFTHMRMGGLDWHRNGKALREEGYTTTLIGKEAAGIVEHHNPEKPLFLYVPFNAPHTPLQAPESYLKQYEDVKPKKRKIFSAMVTALDDEVGRIVAALEKRKMLDNTLIVFSSDNGGPTRLGADNGKFRGSKGTLYEGGVRVAAFAHWRGKLKPGAIEEPLHMVDWYPTLLKLAGSSSEQEKPLDGKDIWPVLTEGAKSPHKEILFNAEPTRGAIRIGDWKLKVKGPLPRPMDGKGLTMGVELFDLKADPYEKNNLAEKNLDKVRELMTRLNAYAREAVPPLNKKGGKPAGFKVPKVWGESDQPADPSNPSGFRSRTRGNLTKTSWRAGGERA